MCDGQYKVMQNFLREQTGDIDNVNMVGEVANFLYEVSKNRLLNIEAVRVFNQLLQALKEICVGNNENRRVTFDANVMSVINYVLQVDITNIKKESGSWSDLDNEQYAELRKMALDLKASAVELLDVLLEEISSSVSTLSQQIAESLDITALHWSMQDFYALRGDPDLQRMKADDNAYRALYGSYRIIRHMMDNEMSSMDILSELHKFKFRFTTKVSMVLKFME